MKTLFILLQNATVKLNTVINLNKAKCAIQIVRISDDF